MLNQESNEKLCRVGLGTPMGELLRRYWHPVGGASELNDKATKAIRLMGEDLVAYRDKSGTLGLIGRRCAHRNVDLVHGYVEECGLRCAYHGWLYDETGQCIAQPFEDTANAKARFKDKIRLKSYRLAEKAGILWAYLGPEPAPLVPNFEPFTWKNGFKQVAMAELPCNWFQCHENSIDPIHFEWTHANWGRRLNGVEGPYAPAHVQTDFEEFEHGFIYKRIREDTDENHELWTVGRACLWPNAMYTGDHIEWRVPMDDETTLSVTWAFDRVPQEAEPYEQNSVPAWYGPIVDDDGNWITSHIMNQDFVMWTSQGQITNRANENLGMSDRGIAMIRKQYFDDMKRVETGEDPKCVIRDPDQNVCLELPVGGREYYINGVSKSNLEKANELTGFRVYSGRYAYQFGQPQAVRDQWFEAMQLTPDELPKYSRPGP